jgi:adenosylmethionine-8-amino-7-oxononanoate aminotransferase
MLLLIDFNMTTSKIIFPFSRNNNQEPLIKFDTVWDFGYIKNNKEYIDLSLGSCGCFPLGFKRDDFSITVQKQLQDFPFISGDFKTTNKYVEILSERFFDMTSYHSMFCLSGSDAVESAIKMADMYHQSKGKPRKIKCGFKDSYHGSTYLSSSISGSLYMHEAHGRHPDCVSLDYEIESIENFLNSDVSCVIIETCSWQAGLNTQNDEWWKRLRACCTKYDIVLIIDDIAFTGYKTEKFFGYNQNINPDIVCFGKAVSAGYYPLSGCLLNPSFRSVIEDQVFLHGFSYSFSMSGILSALHYIDVNANEGISSQYHNVKEQYSKIFNLPNLISINNFGLMYCLEVNFQNKSNVEIFNIFLENNFYIGLWNSNLIQNKLLIQCPNVYDSVYAEKLHTGLLKILTL